MDSNKVGVAGQLLWRGCCWVPSFPSATTGFKGAQKPMGDFNSAACNCRPLPVCLTPRSGEWIAVRLELLASFCGVVAAGFPLFLQQWLDSRGLRASAVGWSNITVNIPFCGGRSLLNGFASSPRAGSLGKGCSRWLRRCQCLQHQHHWHWYENYDGMTTYQELVSKLDHGNYLTRRWWKLFDNGTIETFNVKQGIMLW